MIGVQNRKKTKGTLKNKRSRSLFAITYKIQIIFIHSSMHSVYLFYTGVAVGIPDGADGAADGLSVGFTVTEQYAHENDPANGPTS